MCCGGRNIRRLIWGGGEWRAGRRDNLLGCVGFKILRRLEALKRRNATLSSVYTIYDVKDQLTASLESKPGSGSPKSDGPRELS